MQESRCSWPSKLLEYQTELQNQTQGIIQAKSKAVEDLKWVKENVEKMEETLSAFQNAQQQVSSDKEGLAEELEKIEKRMAERTVEVEARLRDAAATVVGLKDKIVSLERDIKFAKEEEAALREPSSCLKISHSSQASSDKGTELLKEKLVAAEAQLKSDSDLVSKLYDRVCMLNLNLQQTKGSASNHRGAELPRCHEQENRRYLGESLGDDTRRYNRATSPLSEVTSGGAETEKIFLTAGRKMEAAGLQLHRAGERVEAAEAQLQEATRTIAQLKEKVRLLTAEVRRARSASPDCCNRHSGGDCCRRQVEGHRCMETSRGVERNPPPWEARSPYTPAFDVTRIEEPDSVRTSKVESALSSAQEKCRVLNLEISYMERKKAAAIEAIKTLEAAMGDKRSLLKSTEQDIKRMRRTLRRNGSIEPPQNRAAFGNLFKGIFNKSEPSVDKYMIRQQVRKL